MEVAEGPSALEVATTEDPAPEGGAGSYLAPEGVAGSDPALVGSASYNPAPEGVQECSLSHASMDVQVGSSPPRSDGATASLASTALTGQVALEVGEVDARSMLSVCGAEVTPDSALQIVLADLPSSSHVSAPPALGLPLFLSNLQVSRSLALCCTY
jgi:Tfp pilus assembly protein PilW